MHNLLSLMALPIVSLLLAASVATPTKQDSKSSEKKQAKKPNFTISKETTYVTGPVMVDGYIDYVAAFNELLKKGVTAENNAMVLLVKAVGPKPEGVLVPESYFNQIGCDRPSEDGQYFVPLDKHHKEQPGERISVEAEMELTERVTKRPWSDKEFPLIDAWLNRNAEPMKIVTEAVKRSRYFTPAVTRSPEYTGLMAIMMPYVHPNRKLTEAFVIRAMRHLGNKRWAEAKADLLTVHRLSRTAGQGGTLIDLLVGIAIEQYASAADRCLLAEPEVDFHLLREYRKELDALHAHGPLHERLNHGERLMFLDSMQLLDMKGIDYIEKMAGGSSPGDSKLLGKSLSTLFIQGIPLDAGLKEGNAWYDRLVSTLKIEDDRSRKDAINELDNEIKLQRAKIGNNPGSLFFLKKEERSKGFADLMKVLLTPALIKVRIAEEKMEVNQRLNQIAFALEFHRREQGIYPEKLVELQPKHLRSLPNDIFSQQPLVYLKSAKGYRIYSVGPNGKDEQGQGMEDVPRGDDVRIEMPLPPLPRQVEQ